MDVAVDTVLTDLTYSSCGSHLSIVNQNAATCIAPPLSTLGRFELIERLGVGSFGSVWKARDKELDRTVAIKVPRAGGMSEEEQEKFFREARAAAQLRHPNIVSVYEVGRDGDSVYIVSEIVRGVTLGDWLTGQQPTSREAAELCATVAEALDHAHEQGVVHRDLKPANIMIDGDGQPHLMDFGLARRDVGEVTVTMEGQVMGTPAYMSPEQAQGEAHQADRRSDIYSLGAILFQLLTGELPFRGNMRMLMHQVIHDEPPSPRKLNATIRKDLETIALKCLEKSPARRYQTGQELANDLRRFLRNEPIVARPVPKWERAAKWVRRHPAPSALVFTFCLAIVAGIAGLTWHTRALEFQNDRLILARGEAEGARVTAQQEAENARKLAEFFVRGFESADPIKFAGYTPGASVERFTPQGFLDRGRKYVLDAKDLQPATRARLLNSIGGAYAGSGRLSESYDCLIQALEIRKKLSHGAPSKELVSTLNNLGFLNFLFGRYAEAEEQFRKALLFEEQLSTSKDGMDREKITTKIWLGATLLETQRGSEIKELLEGVVDARSPELKDYDRDFAIAALGLTIVSTRLGDPAAAMKRFEQALEIMQESQDEMLEVLALSVQSVFKRVLGNHRGAAKNIEEALSRAEQIVGDSHPILHILRIDLADAYQGMGKPELAEEKLKALLPVAKRMFGIKPRTAGVARHLGDVLRDLKRNDEAIAQYEAADSMIDKQIDHYDDAEISYRLGMMALLEGRADDARPLFQNTINFQEQLRGGMQHPVVAYGNLGMALLDSANPVAMKRELQKAERIVQRLSGDTSMVVDRTTSFGDTFRQAGKNDYAEILYRAALKFHDGDLEPAAGKPGLFSTLLSGVKKSIAPNDSYFVGRASFGLGHCLLDQGHSEQARPHLERAARIFDDQLGADDQRTIEAKALLVTP